MQSLYLLIAVETAPGRGRGALRAHDRRDREGLSYSQSSESDAGLSRRIFGRLLGRLQDRKAPVFVIATGNAINQLPPKLMRKDRFDEIFFKKRKRDPANFDLDHPAAASDGFTGAEIEQVVVAALYTPSRAASSCPRRFWPRSCARRSRSRSRAARRSTSCERGPASAPSWPASPPMSEIARVPFHGHCPLRQGRRAELYLL